MSTQIASELQQKIEAAARAAHLTILAAESGQGTDGSPTAKFRLGLSAEAVPGHTLMLELSEGFDPHKPDLLPELTSHLAEQARRLRNPRPDAGVTRGGLPLSFSNFQWPFHHSTSGWDSVLVHGKVTLEDGQNPPLVALVAASVTITFLEFLRAPEQPYAENFIYNAILKTFDQGQLELLKNGGLQPVPITTRYYSRWKKKFVFSETSEQGRLDYLALKVYWLSGVLGGSEPVWITDPRDAQYLDTAVEDLEKKAAELAKQGLVKLNGDAAAPTSKLMDQAEAYKKKLGQALDFTRPTFNEDMRAGRTNM